MSFGKDNTLMMELIKGFDKSLAEKASKNSLENFMIDAQNSFASAEA